MNKMFFLLLKIFKCYTMAASTFLFHPLMNEVVPYNAVYEFPSQATRSTKRTIKMTPKNSSATYVSGSTIRFEFPASGYLNPNTTYLAFNCKAEVNTGSTWTPGTLLPGGMAFQNNIASIFRRVRVLYGSLVLEDIQDYNILQRMFTEVLQSSGTTCSNSSQYQGIGPLSNYQQSQATIFNGPFSAGYKFARFNYHSQITSNDGTTLTGTPGSIARRYCIPINTGVFQQKRLLPLKFMSSQLQIEFELADGVDCQHWIRGTNTVDPPTPTVPNSVRTVVGLPEIVAELLEFDAEFDQAVFQGLKQGLAIPFQSWHMTSYNLSPNINVQVNIQESSRSVRYALAGLTDDGNRVLSRDTHAFFCGWGSNLHTFTGGELNPLFGANRSANEQLIESFQWRLGGVYYPSQPVACFGGTALTTDTDANYADPPVEAYMELMKVFDNQFVKRYSNGSFAGYPFASVRDNSDVETGGFILACDFMTDRGDVIGGINAEEQNDMMLIMKFNGGGGTAKTLRVAVCYDNVMILGENNNLVLVN